MTKVDLGRVVKDGKVPPLVLLYGEETYLVDVMVRELTAFLVPPDLRDFNLEIVAGKDVSARQVLQSAATLPVFNPCRLVVVRDSQDIPAGELEAFLPYLKNPIPESVLLFVADKIDGRKKFYSDFKKYGRVVEFKRPGEQLLPETIQSRARESGYSFTEAALALFITRVGNDLREIHSELDKLFSYLGETRRLVDVADVESIICDTRNENVFALTNAMGRRNLPEALKLLHRLLDEGTAPLMLLTMMVRHFRQLWKVSDLMRSGASRKDLSGQVGVNPYFIDGLIEQSRRFQPVQFRTAFELFLRTDLALKSSGAHPSALMEKLLIDLGRLCPE